METAVGRAVAVLRAGDPSDPRSEALEAVELDWGGVPGDRHHGVTRVARGFESIHRRGVVMRNRRQVSVVALEECAAIAERVGVEVSAQALGANLLTAGIPELTQLPFGTLLLFPSGATLLVEVDNPPCSTPGRVLQALHPDRPHLARDFVRAAVGRRGVLCSVDRPGRIAPGDHLQVVLPEPPARPRG